MLMPFARFYRIYCSFYGSFYLSLRFWLLRNLLCRSHVQVQLLKSYDFISILKKKHFDYLARAQPKIDLREFPDTQGICRGPGFHRNETDCTQFYRLYIHF